MQDRELLNYVYKGAEMGRDGLMHVIQRCDDPKFRKTLQDQLTEYEKVFDAADQMVRERGGKPEDTGAMAKMASYVMANAKTMTDHSPSHIAEMVIQGSTMGVTKIQKHLNDYDGHDERVRDLSHKLLKTEQANIEEMKKYL